MSKIGKLPIKVVDGVTVSVNGETISIAGASGSTTFTVPTGINVAVEEGNIVVSQQKKGDINTRAMYGLVRATLANLVKGASTGFEKKT